MSILSRIGILDILIVAGAGYAGTVLIKNGRLADLIRNFKLLLKALLNSEYQGEIEDDWQEDFESFSLFDGFVDERFPARSWEEQDQSKLSGRSPGLLTYSGTPYLKGVKDNVETPSCGSDRSASDSIVPDGMFMSGLLS